MIPGLVAQINFQLNETMISFLPSSVSLVSTLRNDKSDNVFRKLHAKSIADRESVCHDLLGTFAKPNKVTSYQLCVNDSQLGKTFEESYIPGGLLGEGAYAKVYSCKHKGNNHEYAVKEINDEEYEEGGQLLQNEIDALKALFECPFVVRMHDIFTVQGATDEEGTTMTMTYLTMERLNGDDLLEAIYRKGRYSDNEAKKVSRTLLEAVGYCHKKRIVHREIKPENILLVSQDSDTDIKLCDFGQSRIMPDDPDCLLRTMCGSKRYCAPEVYDSANGYDQQCDLWSTGVVVYLMLCGYLPFDGESWEIPTMICEGDYVFPEEEWNTVADAPKELIQKLLVVDPKERLTAHQALNSNWMHRIGEHQRNFQLSKARMQPGRRLVPTSSYYHASPRPGHKLNATCA
jgi:calcium/calmodulin-dependent protein kinase I